MKLHYFHGRTPIQSLVLWHNQRRLELHVKKVVGGVWSVVILAGGAQGQPDTTRCRGPYHDREKAESALRHLAGALLEQSYRPNREEPAQWSVCAQRLARNLRLQAEANNGRFQFDPELPEPTF